MALQLLSQLSTQIYYHGKCSLQLGLKHVVDLNDSFAQSYRSALTTKTSSISLRSISPLSLHNLPLSNKQINNTLIV